MVLIRRMHQVCCMVGNVLRDGDGWDLHDLGGWCIFLYKLILINHCFCFVFLLETSRGALGDGVFRWFVWSGFRSSHIFLVWLSDS